MAYATRKDLEDTYGVAKVAEIADRGDGVSTQAIENALDSASALIDANISVLYSVPIDPPPIVLRDICIIIAIYRLAVDPLKQTADMRKRFEDAIALLERVAEGKASIGLDKDSTGHSSDQISEPHITYLRRA
jgi:phage gp36-like protein